MFYDKGETADIVVKYNQYTAGNSRVYLTNSVWFAQYWFANLNRQICLYSATDFQVAY